MPSYGLQLEGFLAKPLSEILSELETDAVAIWGPNVDLSPESLIGQEIGLIAGMFDDHWQTTAELATVLDPSNAQGVLLSKLVQLNGLTRQEDGYTAVTAEVIGTAPTVLSAGAIAENTEGDTFVLQGDVTFTGGSDTSSWLASLPGPVPCEAGTLTAIVTPRPGWLSITNAAAAVTVGFLEEEDGALRRRRETSTEAGAVHMFVAMQSSVLGVTGVTDLLIIENTTGSVDALGLPAHSFRAVVEGGDDDEIAQAIWDKHPSGIAWSGAESGTAVDSNGSNHTVNFGRPVYVPIHIAIVLSLQAGFPAGGDALMKQAIVDYNAGDLPLAGDAEDADPAFHPKTSIGDDAGYSPQYIPINSIPGHTVTAYTMSRTNNPPLVTDLSDEAITDLEKAQYLIANIDIT